MPDADNFFVWQLDDYGSGIEVYRAGTELQPGGPTGGGFIKKEIGRVFGPTHVALSIATDADAVDYIESVVPKTTAV